MITGPINIPENDRATSVWNADFYLILCLKSEKFSYFFPYVKLIYLFVLIVASFVWKKKDWYFVISNC